MNFLRVNKYLIFLSLIVIAILVTIVRYHMQNSDLSYNNKSIENYGMWKSPFTTEVITKSAKQFMEVYASNNNIFWLERRPEEAGRSVLVMQNENGDITDITPKYNKRSKENFNVRTRVQEYGGLSFIINRDIVYFVNYQDQRLYKQKIGSSPQPLTKQGIRYADLQFTKHGIVAVGETNHGTKDGAKAVKNFIALINVDTGEQTILREGNDFYAYPTISKDGSKIAWIEWSHPNMPWDSTELFLGDFVGNKINSVVKIAGNGNESVLEPNFRDDNDLYFVTDRDNWWNIYKYSNNDIKQVYKSESEFSGPMWTQGSRHWGFFKDKIIAIFSNNSFGYIAVIDSDTGGFSKIDIQGSTFSSLKTFDSKAILIRYFTNQPSEIILLNLEDYSVKVAYKTDNAPIDKEYISEPEAIEYFSNGRMAKALYYPPTNKDYKAPEDQKPPLIVSIHGGPTGQAVPVFNPKIQFWTSRGFAVADINYGGSTGFGREYRLLLNNKWGVIDVEDCENGAQYLAAKGLVDIDKLAIHGGSAGGYTTLAALTFGNIFTVGASYYGVSDLKALTEETHKFESRYLDNLLGSYPEKATVYYSRSPINYVNKLNKPIIFFQGDEDKIVPLNQATKMYEALKERGIKTELVIYEGEQHGFRKAENIQNALEKELSFLLDVFY